ncbi:hypothetical protein [Streptomyces sp. HPF1205]|uniref:hypothetical protein n=1 Tax=Streptomyces sp. HPF1205 TaxID=2873262 RepID=UPI001CEDF8E7|nr:hypothetical protein [Streptomyces sp. HPF1205]
MSSEHDEDARTGEDTGTEAREPGRDEDRGPARRSRLVVACVAAAVLLAGGGGAWWAAAAGGGSSDAGGNRPSGNGEPRDASAPEGWPVAGAVYKLTGTLPAHGPKSAPVYRPSGRVGQDEVRRLATALGLSGPVVDDQGFWRVGTAPGTGTGPVLTVGKEGPATWSYLRAAPPVPHMRPDATGNQGPAASPAPGGAGPASGASTSSHPGSGASVSSGPAAAASSGASAPDVAAAPSAVATPAPAPRNTVITYTAKAADPAEPPVSEAKAMSVAAPVLAELGLSGARTDASRTLGPMRTVTADPVVGGLPTSGWSTQLEIGHDGKLDEGYGRLAPLTAGGTYPVDGAAAAFKRLGAESAATATVCSAPVPSATHPSDDKKLPLSRPCMSAGSPRTMEVRGAAFGLSAQFMSGTQELVPSWLFDVAPSGVRTTSVVAEPAVPAADLSGGSAGTEPGQSGPGRSAPGRTPSPGVNPGGPDMPGPAMPSDPRAPLHVKPTGYRASGTTLTLTFFGGVCDTYKATADESATQVRVNVTATPKPSVRVCPMIARSFTVSVQLKQPLGDRTVVNAQDGRPVKGQ